MMKTDVKKVFIGSDHAGFQLKSHVVAFLKSQGIEVVDCGTTTTDSCHYPEYAIAVVKGLSPYIQKNEQTVRGILICGSGMGVSIVANKFKGVRAGLCRDREDVLLAREHNDINILCMGERRTIATEAEVLVSDFLQTPCAEGRHRQRLDLFQQLGSDV